MSVVLFDSAVSKVSVPMCLLLGFLIRAPTFLGFSSEQEWEDTVNYSICAPSTI